MASVNRAAVAGAAAVAMAVSVGLAGGATPAVAGGKDWIHAWGRFAPWDKDFKPGAVTYDTDAVPAGASIDVEKSADSSGTTVRVRLKGIEADRAFDVRVHTGPCGALPDDSGQRYQDRVDPKQPSVDPAFANRRNEVWLNFTTDRKGAGEAVSHNAWRFRPGKAGSVVLHGRTTARGGHGEAPAAEERLACFTVPFGAKR
ncbi:superoxide dismutase family protein [Streptomyces sp. NPDC004647]|uniref:superoxide dismutase family protein n=1 Tax=Streptomyces sp. NPDC004647 TaxID=3154671 RepID=UPI0033A353F7